MNTHRAYMGADTVITCWVRNEAGNRDLRAATLTVPVTRYGKADTLFTMSAEQAEDPSDLEDANGQIQFTVTEALADANLVPGIYRFQIKTADNEVVYGGLLEMV